MAEDDYGISRVTGEPTSMRGNERTMHKHKYDQAVLVGVEHRPVSDLDMRLYLLTSNLFRSLFPKNFAKVVAVGRADSGEGLSLVAKVDAKAKFGPEYREGKKIFLESIAQVFTNEAVPNLEEMFDFRGDKPNLLMENGVPVFVDKVDPEVLPYLDKSKIEKIVSDPKRRGSILGLLVKTEKLLDQKRAQREKANAILDSLAV